MQLTVWKPITWIYPLYCNEININLLLNTCNFYRKFRFIFSLNLSENKQNVHFREAKLQNFPGSMPPEPPCVLAPLNCFRRACYYKWLILSMIMTLWKIFAVDTQFKQLRKRSLKKNSGFSGIWTRDLCDTGAVLYQLSYEAITVGSRSILVGPSCH